jgi:cytochrome P450
MSRDDKLHGDPVKLFKEVYPHFDLAICNFYSEALLEIINPELVKEFYQNNNENNYVKADVITSSFKMLVKHGIIMKEGQEWKLRKKIISSVFTHDFLVHLLPEIHKITISRLD